MTDMIEIVDSDLWGASDPRNGIPEEGREMTDSVKHIYKGYARAMEYRSESYEKLVIRAAIAESARKILLAEGHANLAWNLEGEISGYYDLMRGISQ